MGKKTYRFCNLRNERISKKKKQLTLLKMYVTSILCGPRADLWPFYWFLCKRFSLYIKVGYRNDRFFLPYKSLYFDCYATMPMLADAHISSLGYLCLKSLIVHSALLPSDVIDFAMLPAQRFWRETVSLLDVM